MLPTSPDAASSASPTPASARPRFSAAESRFSATEPRFWPKYVDSHRATLLDGEWSYGLHRGMLPAQPELDLSSPDWTPNTTTVPSCIDPEPPGYMGPRATAVYRTTFQQTSERARLWFGACSFYCRVWVDDTEVGEHRAGVQDAVRRVDRCAGVVRRTTQLPLVVGVPVRYACWRVAGGLSQRTAVKHADQTRL